jgi:SIR2-like domain
MQNALSDVFSRMNLHLADRQFEFSNDLAHSIQKFLVRFDAIFTLNQDLLIEVHYNNQNVALWHGTHWRGYELPGLRELPLEDPLAGRARSKWVPQDRFAQTPDMQPYFKLHGSTAWSAADGSSLMVMGRDKVGLIRSNAILRWNYERFEEYLARPDTRLMVIGYGFADDHINATIVSAHQRGHLRLMYLVHPSGKVVLDLCPTATIRVPQPIMEIPCIECTVPLSAAFSTDHMAQSLLEGIFV